MDELAICQQLERYRKALLDEGEGLRVGPLMLNEALQQAAALIRAQHEALTLAAHELNAIRARDGAPQHIQWDRGRPIQTDSCTHEWWNTVTERCYAALAKAKEI